MNKLQVIKIALLIVILAEEIRNAKKSKVFKVKIDADTSNLKDHLKSLTAEINSINAEKSEPFDF